MAYEFKGITPESNKLVNDYLVNKNSTEKSKKTTATALRRLFEALNKDDIRQINHDDYVRHVKEVKSKSKSPSIFQTEFIKYLYAYDFLYDTSGFNKEYWIQDAIREKFEKESSKNDKPEQIYSPGLKFEELERIQQFISHISEDSPSDLLKLDLAFFMCFYTNIGNVTDLREADTKNYKNGIWSINGAEYQIPKKYEPLLTHLQETKNSKFSAINTHIKKLGDRVGIPNLTPSHITTARSQLQAICFECGTKYFVFTDNWSAVNGKIVCNSCADKIRSKFDVKKNYIENDLTCYVVDVLTIEEKISNEVVTTPFDDLRDKLRKKFDFAGLQEYLQYIGDAGEEYVYQKEREYLRGTDYYDEIDPSPAKDHNNGYDILSFERDGTPVMIEVKTTVGNENDYFYVTDREWKTAQKAWNEGRKYKFYRVSKILAEDRNQIALKIFDSYPNWEMSEVVFKIREKPTDKQT